MHLTHDAKRHMLPEPDALVEDAGLYDSIEPTIDLIPVKTVTLGAANVQ